MTDKEIIRTIADKIMGWGDLCCPEDCGRVHDVLKTKSYICHNRCDKRHFNPLTSDADCMMAWDEFCRNIPTFVPAAVNASIEISYGDSGTCCSIRGEFDVLSTTFNTDRRRAMCECMVKGVT